MQSRIFPFRVLLEIVQRPDIREGETSDEDYDYRLVSSYISDLILLLHLPSPPRLSGFLKLKASTAFTFIRAWKERWLVMTQDNDQKRIHIYRKRRECYPTKFFTVCPQHRVAEEPSLSGPGLFCFSFAIVEGERITLAATSEFQMWSWISCIQSSSLD
jgi:hypothetical protein